MRRSRNTAERGFTLIELMIVISIIGILAAISVPNYQIGVVKARESVLREDLHSLRTTIDQFCADQGRYPDSLQDLVDKKYLHSIPKDPFTRSSDTWVIISPPAAEAASVGGRVYDIHSGSTLIGADNKPYNEW